MTLKETRKAVYDVLKPAFPEWNVYATVPGTPTYPAITVVPSDDTTWTRESMGGGVWMLDVYVLVGYTEMESAQDILDDAIDPKVEDSVFDVLNKNSTLDGKVMDSTPTNVMFYGRAQAGEAGGAPFIGAQIRLEVREC
jgi:hypothetical protein